MRAPHPIATMLRVRELAEAGWAPTEMLPILRREGLTVPSLTTIYLWINPEYRERSNAATRRRAARRSARESSFRWPAKRGPEWKAGRAGALREAGLSCAAVAKVMSFDFPETPLTEHEVRGMLDRGRIARVLRNAA